jgi:riboflavin kinase/FMN adenylyltransferase
MEIIPGQSSFLDAILESPVYLQRFRMVSGSLVVCQAHHSFINHSKHKPAGDQKPTMLIIHNLQKDLKKLPGQGLVMAVGNFDGLHLGHQAVIGRAVDIARQQEFAAGVLTFRQHPRSILHPKDPPVLLLPPGDKVERIQQMGVEVLINLNFTLELASLSPKDFVDHLLCEELHLAQIIVGENFRFGKDRKGTTDLLKEEGGRCGFTVTVIPPVKIGDEVVSSTRIRRLLEKGEVRQAGVLLNREYEIRGRVISGDRRGQLLGVPTANLEVVHELIPRPGVYAVWAVCRGHRYPAMGYIGNRPTFPKAGPSIEVHLLDFSDNLYDETIEVYFVDWIRGEQYFSSTQALQSQLKEDRLAVQSTLGCPKSDPE